VNVRTVAFVNWNTHEQTGRFSLGKLLLDQGPVFPFVAAGFGKQYFQQHEHITICRASASRPTSFIPGGKSFKNRRRRFHSLLNYEPISRRASSELRARLTGTLLISVRLPTRRSFFDTTTSQSQCSNAYGMYSAHGKHALKIKCLQCGNAVLDALAAQLGNPFNYLKDLFIRLAAAKITQIKEFTPAAWAKSRVKVVAQAA
jgi:hypothetical protein